jgi:hypothetical protein
MMNVRHYLPTIALVVVLASVGKAEDPTIQRHRKEYESARAEAERIYRESITASYRKYVDALDSLKKSATAKGDLDRAIEIKKEQQRMESELASFLNKHSKIDYDFASILDLRDFLLAGSKDCSLKEGVLAIGPGGHCILKAHFTEVKSMTFEARILKPEGNSLHFAAGQLTALLNWEDAQENHLRYEDVLTKIGGKPLVPGRYHKFRVFQNGKNVDVMIDGDRFWRCTGTLAGTCAIYGGAGVIQVKNLSVEGKIDFSQEVTGSSHFLY